MNIPSKFYILFSMFSLLVLSACGERFHIDMLKMADHDLLSSHAGEAQQQAENNNTALPVQNPSRRTATGIIKVNDSVEIFDMEPIAGYTRNAPAPMANNNMANNSVEVFSSTPINDAYGRGQFASDKSVTIYNLDGQPIQTGIDFGRTKMASAYNDSVGGSSYRGNASVGAGAANQIFFKHGSSRLGSGDMRKVSTLADEAKFAPVNYISVEGYASRPTQYGKNTTQAHITNLRQSAKRAEKVTSALIRKGVPGEKIKTVSWGATKATGRNAYDRRVDVNIGGQ